jgi:hypothetical protein
VAPPPAPWSGQNGLMLYILLIISENHQMGGS